MAMDALSDAEYELFDGIPQLIDEMGRSRYRAQKETLDRILLEFLNRLDQSKYPRNKFILYEDHFRLGLKPGNLYTSLMLQGILVPYEQVKDRKSIKIKGIVYSYDDSV